MNKAVPAPASSDEARGLVVWLEVGTVVVSAETQIQGPKEGNG